MSESVFDTPVICNIKDGKTAYVAKYAFTISSEHPEDSHLRIDVSHPCYPKRKRGYTVKARRTGDVYQVGLFDMYRVIFSKEFKRTASYVFDVARLFGAITGGDDELCLVQAVWSVK